MMKELETLKEGMAATTVVAAACTEGPGIAGPIFVDKCRHYLQVRVRVCGRVCCKRKPCMALRIVVHWS